MNKILTSYIYFNLVWITEKCIVLSGAENTWIFFKVINNFILTSNIWFGNNCITGYSILNKNQKSYQIELPDQNFCQKVYFDHQ